MWRRIFKALDSVLEQIGSNYEERHCCYFCGETVYLEKGEDDSIYNVFMYHSACHR